MEENKNKALTLKNNGTGQILIQMNEEQALDLATGLLMKIRAIKKEEGLEVPVVLQAFNIVDRQEVSYIFTVV